MTPKQEEFARAFVETGNASEAYRRAYNAENMKRESIAVEACKLLDDPNVSQMVEALKEEALQRHRLTVDDLLRELEEARMAAYQQEKPQAAAMVAASMGKAKLLGLEAPTKLDHTSSDGTMSPKGKSLDDFYTSDV
jgi:phage terminase small subunit